MLIIPDGYKHNPRLPSEASMLAHCLLRYGQTRILYLIRVPVKGDELGL